MFRVSFLEANSCCSIENGLEGKEKWTQKDQFVGNCITQWRWMRV